MQQQPKFKHGDKVRNKLTGRVFEIDTISREGQAHAISPFRYSGKGSQDFGYCHTLELYQEPKPKKLYAYAVNSGQIKFFLREDLLGYNKVSRGGYTSSFERAPEYDLDYDKLKRLDGEAEQGV